MGSRQDGCPLVPSEHMNKGDRWQREPEGLFARTWTKDADQRLPVFARAATTQVEGIGSSAPVLGGEAASGLARPG